MMMPHPLIPVSLPPASVTMAMSQMNHLSTIANMAAAAQGQSLPSRMVTSVIKVTFKAERTQQVRCRFISVSHWLSHETEHHLQLSNSQGHTVDSGWCVTIFPTVVC